MKVVNLLDFINNALELSALDYAKCPDDMVNYLNIASNDEQFTQKVDLGLIFVHEKTIGHFTIVDGLGRITSLALLLHAICECYKKTTSQNEKAIRTIRKKYLFTNAKTKLRLSESDDIVYNKIINGERLSGQEKETPIFKQLHKFWAQIKEDKLQAANIFKALKKICVTLVETENVSKRDLYYKLNLNKDINQLSLIENFLAENGVLDDWHAITKIFGSSENDIKKFLQDFFVTKFNYKDFSEKGLYENFVNYFETIMQYMSEDTLMKNLKRSAKLYSDILNVNFANDDIKKAFIEIKRNAGEDTYAYILDVYEDYTENNISESTFIEILNTIIEYLKSRLVNSNNVQFNELIKYLNAFITCK